MIRPHVLVVAFRPFGGRDRNESERALAAMRLPPGVRSAVRTLRLPVSWRRAPRLLARALERPGLRAVILSGEAARRAVVTPERWARNVASGAKDVDGRLPRGARLDPRGPSRRRATWRGADVVRVLRAAGLHARESRDAGGYLCNAVLYAALGHPRVARERLPVAFVHLPVPGAGARRDLTPAGLARALGAVVRAAVARARPIRS